MATAYQSSSTSAFATANSVTITKPSGLAVGDLMLAHIVMTATGGTNQEQTGPSGWTNIDSTSTTGGSPYMKTYVWYIVATATEVAASDFTWTITNQPGVSVGGGILRIDGQNTITAIDTYSKGNTEDAGDSYSFSGADPTYGESLMVIFAASNQNASNSTISGYALATSDPTWTERWDFNHDPTAVIRMGCATAVRTEDTATGNVTFVNDEPNNGGTCDNHGFLIIVRPIASVTVTPDPVTLTLSIPTVTATGGATVSPSVITLTLSIPTSTVSINNWINPSKNTASFTNQSKNSATFTNVNKNSSTWTNQDKTYE